jgi:hypothetical protein
MISLSNYGVSNDFQFTKEECDKFNIPDLFISFKASSWMSEETIARRFVSSTFGSIAEPNGALGAMIRGLNDKRS